MNSLLDDKEYDDDPPADRELTLGTGTILAIFFGIVLLCGAFFGFGYKMGSTKPVQPVIAAAPETSTTPSTNFNSFKPAAGSPIGSSPAPAPSHPAQPDNIPDDEPSTAPPTAHTAPPTPTHQIPAADPAPEPIASGSFVVQVAAFTHQEDADLLVHALKAKGYPAFARTEPQDKLQHIQVGPFTTHKDAEAAKQRLLADGYQPILK